MLTMVSCFNPEGAVASISSRRQRTSVPSLNTRGALKSSVGGTEEQRHWLAEFAEAGGTTTLGSRPPEGLDARRKLRCAREGELTAGAAT